MIEHIKLTIKGRVQGVWFRASTKQEADDLGVFGFVKNLTNGDVYIEAEGTKEQLEKFTIWCKKGPTQAHVETINQVNGIVERFTNFKIR